MIVCIISVVLAGQPFVSRDALHGKVLEKDRFNYIADFSHEAKEKGYEGDYSKVKVSRGMCVISTKEE